MFTLSSEMDSVAGSIANRKIQAEARLKLAALLECQKLEAAIDAAKIENSCWAQTSGSPLPFDGCLEFYELTSEDGGKWTVEMALGKDAKESTIKTWGLKFLEYVRELLRTDPSLSKVKYVLEWEETFSKGRNAYINMLPTDRKKHDALADKGEVMDYRDDKNICNGNWDRIGYAWQQRVQSNGMRNVHINFYWGYSVRFQEKTKSTKERVDAEFERLKQAQFRQAQSDAEKQRAAAREADRQKKEREAAALREAQRKAAEEREAHRKAEEERLQRESRDRKIKKEWIALQRDLVSKVNEESTIGMTCYQYARIHDSPTVMSALTIRQKSLGHLQPIPDTSKGEPKLGCDREVNLKTMDPQLRNLCRYKTPQWFTWRCPECRWPVPKTPSAFPKAWDHVSEHGRHGLVVKQLIDANFCAKVISIQEEKNRQKKIADEAAASGDVVEVPAMTREEKDEEGKKNAIDLDAEPDEYLQVKLKLQHHPSGAGNVKTENGNSKGNGKEPAD